jgi:hypothetical protein
LLRRVEHPLFRRSAFRPLVAVFTPRHAHRVILPS